MFDTNPVFSDKNLSTVRTFDEDSTITVYGTVLKILLLLVCTAIPFVAIWTQVAHGFMDKVMLYGVVGAVVAFVLAFFIIASPKTACFFAPVYAFCEGLFLGAISAILEMQFKGIAYQAVALTFLCFFTMLLLYSSRLIQNTPKFKKVITIVMSTILVVYLFNFIGYFFHFTIPLVYSSDAWGLGFSILVVIVASLTFISDFDNIERAVIYCYPKSSEWYFAFGIMTGLVWLYLELLNLLSKIYRR